MCEEGKVQCSLHGLWSPDFFPVHTRIVLVYTCQPCPYTSIHKARRRLIFLHSHRIGCFLASAMLHLMCPCTHSYAGPRLNSACFLHGCLHSNHQLDIPRKWRETVPPCDSSPSSMLPELLTCVFDAPVEFSLVGGVESRVAGVVVCTTSAEPLFKSGRAKE